MVQNNLRFIINNDDNEAYHYDDVSGWQANQWHHITITWIIPGFMKTYVDGNLKISNATSAIDLVSDTSNAIYIGSQDTQNIADAVIDEFRISNCVRTEQEIKNNSSFITITSPIGGERWQVGYSHKIT